MMFEFIFLIFIFFGSNCYGNPIPKINDIQNVKPDYKVIKYTYSRDNDTDVMDQEPPNLQLIPLDFLCEFCQVVILKLKERQATEADFEEKIRSECQNSTVDDSSSLCDVINRVNLDRLKSGDPKEICDSQGMCSGANREPGPPGTSPDQNVGGAPKNSDDVDGKRLTVDEKSVNATLLVDDISSPY